MLNKITVQEKQFWLGVWTGTFFSFWWQDRHGSKQAYIEYLQEMPEQWNGWVQFPSWLLWSIIIGFIVASVHLGRNAD